MEEQSFNFYGAHMENEKSFLNQNEEKPKTQKQLKTEKHINELREKTQKRINKKYNTSKFDIKDLHNHELDIAKKSISDEKLEKINALDNKVVKSNDLIQKACFDLTERELKCLNFALSKIKPDQIITENDYVEFELQDLFKAMDLSNNGETYKEIKKVLISLRDKSKWLKTYSGETSFAYFMKCQIVKKYEIGKTKEEKEEIEETTVLDNDLKKYIVRIKFQDELLTEIYKLKKNFTAFFLLYTLQLKGSYVIRLYEMAKSYQNNLIDNKKNIYGFNFYLENIKKNWCIPNSYKNADIKRLILGKKALDQINDKTDIKISIIDTHKTKNKIDYYTLRVEPQEPKQRYSILNDNITEVKKNDKGEYEILETKSIFADKKKEKTKNEKEKES